MSTPETTRALDSRPMRYLLVSAGAFALDLGLALWLRETTGLPISIAAAASFTLAAFCSYLIHEHWTFQRAASRASAGRLARNIAANLAALGARVALIAAMEAMQDPDVALAAVYVIIGAGASISVNYLLNRFWVFAP